MNEVWTQFGNQIGLDMTNETLIQAYEREHPEAYSKEIGDAIMQDEKYVLYMCYNRDKRCFQRRSVVIATWTSKREKRP